MDKEKNIESPKPIEEKTTARTPVDSMVMCVEHRRVKAEYQKDSWFKGAKPLPLCKSCFFEEKKHHPLVFRVLNMRRLST